MKVFCLNLFLIKPSTNKIKYVNSKGNIKKKIDNNKKKSKT
jgi:hypothetical protein